MKQFTKLLMLALFALISLPGWAEKGTITITSSALGLTGSYTTNATANIDGVDFMYTDLMKNNENIQAKAGSGEIWNTTAIPGKITHISVKHTNTGRSTTLYYGTEKKCTSNGETFTGSKEKDITGEYKYFHITRGSNAAYWSSIVITYEKEAPKIVESIAVSGTPTELYTFDAFSHDGITVTATYDDESTADVTNSCDYTGFDNTQTGEQTITVTYEGKTTTYTVNVTSIANTQETAYTVAEARTLIDAGKGLGQGVFVKGIISEITTEYKSQDGIICFNISDDGTTTSDQFNFYRNQKDAGNIYDKDPGYTAGATVIGYGQLTKYKSTYEFAAGNYLVSYTAGQAVAALSFDPTTITGYLDAASEFVAPALTPTNVQETEITYTSSNIAVATIDESGAVTLVGVGTTTITASCTETAEHTAATASYTLTVEANKPESAKYAIVVEYNSKWYAASTSTNDKGEKLLPVEVKVINGSVYPIGDADIVWNWDGTHLTTSNNKKLVATTADKTNVSLITLTSSGNDEWNINDNYGIMNNIGSTRSLIYNYNSGTPYFGYYTTQNIGKSGYSGKAQLLPIADYVTATIGSAQYATMYYSDKNLIVPTGVEAYTYMLDAEGKLDESWVYEAGDVIPAGTGVVIYSETPQSYAFVETTETGDVDTDNLLRGSDEAELTTGGDKYYMLSMNAAGDAGSVGFYWGADNGAAFTNGAHKAYLALPAGATIRSAYLLNGDDEATAIREVNGNTEKTVFSLTGMRLRNTHLTPGLYIVNGKKVMVK